MKQSIIAILKALGFHTRYNGKARLIYIEDVFGYSAYKPIAVTLDNYVSLWYLAFDESKVSQGMSEFAIANSTSLVKPNYLVFDK